VLPGSYLLLTKTAIMSDTFRRFVKYSDNIDIVNAITETLSQHENLSYEDTLCLMYGIYGRLAAFCKEAAIDIAFASSDRNVTPVTPYDAWHDFV